MENITVIETYIRTSGHVKQVTFQIFDKLSPWKRIYRTQTYNNGVLLDPFKIEWRKIEDRIFDGRWGEFKEVVKRHEVEH